MYLSLCCRPVVEPFRILLHGFCLAKFVLLHSRPIVFRQYSIMS